MSAGPDTVEHMFEVAADAAPVGAATFRAWRDALAGLDREVDDAERVDQIRALEELKAAAAAAQARAAADLHASVRARHAAAGIPVDQQGKGVGAHVALARRESRTAAAGTSGWRLRSPPRCRTPCPRCRPDGSRSGGRPCWSGRPRS